MEEQLANQENAKEDIEELRNQITAMNVSIRMIESKRSNYKNSLLHLYIYVCMYVYTYIEDQSGLGSAFEAGLLLPRSDPSSGSDGWQRVIQRGGVHVGEERPLLEDEVRQSLGSYRENGETVERGQRRVGQIQVSVISY